jgi:hypothetical protein
LDHAIADAEVPSKLWDVLRPGYWRQKALNTDAPYAELVKKSRAEDIPFISVAMFFP